MALQNRVDPWGSLNSNPSKAATVMGNRGILHDDQKKIVKPWAGKSWVACDPKFRGIDRKPLFQVGSYSELFFLDEATAYAAGHRPCAYCQREKFNAFKTAWLTTYPKTEPGSFTSIKEIDNQLHRERTTQCGRKATFTAELSHLPDGTIFACGGAAFLLHKGMQYTWSFDGYTKADQAEDSSVVEVLTPKPIVQLFRNGLLKPSVHPSADA